MKILAYIYVILFSSSALGQLTLNSVNFYGETRNKISYLKNYVLSEVGEPVTLKQLEADRKNLVNLPKYAHIHLKIDSFPMYVDATFELYEVQTITPVFDFGGIKENIYWQLGVANSSALGFGLNYNMSYRNTDQRSNYFFNVKLPYIKGKPIGVEILVSRDATLEPVRLGEQSERYLYDRNNVALSGRYYFNPRNIFTLTGSYFTEGYNLKGENPLDFPSDFIHRKVLFAEEFSHNNENYFYYTVNGYSAYIKAVQVINLDQDFDFSLIQAEGKYFAKLGSNGNLAMRLFAGISTNTDSPFAPFVLDSNVNIRGSGNRQERGTSAVTLNVEHRQAVFEKGDIAVQLVGFVDAGIWRLPGRPWSLNDVNDDLRLFSGGGLRFIYKKFSRAVFRADYGIDIRAFEQQGFVLGVGQYF
ncbi:MAG: hypothetical protein AB8B53_13840 [Flavobacteriales bacterium]